MTEFFGHANVNPVFFDNITADGFTISQAAFEQLGDGGKFWFDSLKDFWGKGVDAAVDKLTEEWFFLEGADGTVLELHASERHPVVVVVESHGGEVLTILMVL